MVDIKNVNKDGSIALALFPWPCRTGVVFLDGKTEGPGIRSDGQPESPRFVHHKSSAKK